MIEIDIRVLASGSKGNCYLLSDGTTKILLECGIPIADIQRGLDYQLSSVEGCLISHEHGDHAHAVKDIMKAGIDCYMSSGTKNVLGISNHCACVVKADHAFNLGTWQILPFNTYHDSAEPLGYLLTSGSNKVLFVTDTSHTPYKFQGLTHILLECNYSPEIIQQNTRDGLIPLSTKKRIESSHLSLDKAVEFFKSNNLSYVQEIWLIHLSENNSDDTMFKRTIQGVTGKPVYIATAEEVSG